MNTHLRDNEKDLVDAVKEMTIPDGGEGRNTSTTSTTHTGDGSGGVDNCGDHGDRHALEECSRLNDVSMSSLPRLERHDENDNINSSQMSLTSFSSRVFAAVSDPTITADLTISPLSSTPSSTYKRVISLPEEEEEDGQECCPVTPDLHRDHDHRQQYLHHLTRSQCHRRRSHRYHPGSKILRRDDDDEMDDMLSDQQSIDRRQLLTMRMNALSPSTTPQSRRKNLLGRRSVVETTTTTTTRTTKTKTKKTTGGADTSSTISRSPSHNQRTPRSIHDIMLIPSIPGIEDDDEEEEYDNHQAHIYNNHPPTTESSINTEGMSFDGKTLYFGWENLR